MAPVRSGASTQVAGDVGDAKNTTWRPADKVIINTTQPNCAAVTDADIVKAIHEKIKADSRFNDQWKHINVSSKERVVLLNGWVKGQESVKTLGKYARSTECVKDVKNRLSSVRKDGCGDICIDEYDECNNIKVRFQFSVFSFQQESRDFSTTAENRTQFPGVFHFAIDALKR